MSRRLQVVAQLDVDTAVVDPAMQSLTEDADRYAETCLYGLALAEALTADPDVAAGDERLPIRTPDFLRQEPPLYDQLGEISSRTGWLHVVDRAASARAAEASIGWMAGLWAAIALISEEFVTGLASLPLAALIGVLIFESLLVGGWLAARQSRHRRWAGVPHFVLAVTLAILLVLLLTSPTNVDVATLPLIALTTLLSLIIEVVSVATDKADLLNRLGED